MGIDGGTEAIKVGIYDAEGREISSASSSYPTFFHKPGWAEQDPNSWWEGLVSATKACLKKASINPQEIVGICAGATTCTLVSMKSDGRVLRNALLWMDVRATDQARRIFSSQHEALRYSLAGVSAEWMPAKALWLKENEPNLYHETDYLIEYADWIAFKLTGKISLNLNTITQRWYYHTPTGGWPTDFYAKIGLADLEVKFPPTVLRVGELAGSLCALAAQLFGLPAGIPIAAGGGDAFLALLGLGVVEPGDLGVVMGSSNVLSALSTQETHVPGTFGSFPDAVLVGLNLVEGGQVSTGSILNWFKREFARDLTEQAHMDGPSVYALLDAEAEKVALGSGGLLVLDYFQGNRTPHTDSSAKGVVLGLSLQTTRAHVFRALMEGIAYGMKEVVDTFAHQGCQVSRVIACGGATHSRLFMQIYADVLGQPIYLTRDSEASLLGAAVAAAVGAGIYPTLREAARSMTQISEVYQPDQERHEQYQFFSDQYQQVYQQLKGLMQAVTQHVAR